MKTSTAFTPTTKAKTGYTINPAHTGVLYNKHQLYNFHGTYNGTLVSATSARIPTAFTKQTKSATSFTNSAKAKTGYTAVSKSKTSYS